MSRCGVEATFKWAASGYLKPMHAVVLAIDLSKSEIKAASREGLEFKRWSGTTMAAWREHRQNVPIQCFRDRIDYVDTCVVALSGHEVAGLVWLYRSTDPNRFLRLSEREGEVNHGYVFPKYRGVKLYSALLTWALLWLKEEGYQAAYGVVPIANTPALQACARAGLLEIGRVWHFSVFRPKFQKRCGRLSTTCHNYSTPAQSGKVG